MGFFNREKKGELTPTTPEQEVTSDEPTPIQSGTPSMAEHGKVEPNETTIAAVKSGTESRKQSQDVEKVAPEVLNDMEKKVEGIQNDKEEQEEAEIEYPKSTQLVLITIALCLSVFCMALDNTIISTAIPRITDQFHSIDDV